MSCCGRGAVSAQRGFELKFAEWRVLKMAQLTGRGAKNLKNNVS